MGNKTTDTRFLAGNFISESAVRTVFGQQRRASTTEPEAPSGNPANPPIGRDRAPLRTGERRPLRRWSVAELIARAGGPPPRTA